MDCCVCLQIQNEQKIRGQNRNFAIATFGQNHEVAIGESGRSGKRCQGTIAPYLHTHARRFHTSIVENEVLPVLVAFNQATLSLNILNSSSPKDLVISFVMFTFSNM